MILLLLLLIAPIVIPNPVFPGILLTIRDGQINGQQYLTENKKVYYGFQGIPYAKPPVGKLRFEPPQPPEPWSDVLDTTNDAKSCMSNLYLFNAAQENEDCLYINVYTPSFMTKGQPVMIWIYGGDFVSGDSTKDSYGPDYLIEENVILVTFNYRLGPMGFLSTGDEVMPGNYGLKDQNLALKWVQENIAYFGGDPEKVTIFGQSAGAVSVALHLLSKKSAGLFRAAIIESASALVPWATFPDPRSYALKLAANAGYHGNDSSELKPFLQQNSTMEIVKSTDWIKLDWPVIEVEHEAAFLTQYHYGLFESGQFNRVPIIIGMCSEESLGFLIDPTFAKIEALLYDANPELLVPSDLNADESDTDIIVSKIQDMYIDNNTLFYANVSAYAEYVTDNMFARGILKQAELQSAYTPVYLYQFGYYGRVLTPAFISDVGKAGHSAEIPFLFKLENFSFNDTGNSNVLVQNRLVKLWTNFAKYLNPTPEKSELLSNITWTKLNPKTLNYLNIEDTLELKSGLRQKAYSKWNEIFEDYGQKPFCSY